MLPTAAPGPRDHFNGRLEHPMLLHGAIDAATPIEPNTLLRLAFIAWWDFSRDIPSQTISDHGPHRLHGQLYNLPTRAMRSAFWRGGEMRWTDAPDQYAAVHFHADDLYDCGWDTAFSFDMPENLPSGVYGIRLSAGTDQDVLPVFIPPPPATATATAKVALLFPNGLC